jgi:putative copper export protein/mono/diheme cytochrome c family protein
MLPAFDLQGGLALVAARAATIAPLLSVFGALAFRVLVVPRALGRAPAEIRAGLIRQLMWVARISVAAGLAGGCAWLLVETAGMADAASVRETLEAVPLVLGHTAFGHVLALQGGALAWLAVVLAWPDRAWRAWASLGIAAGALCLQAGHSHAASMYEGPSLLLGADVLHLLGAGAWLGGLLPLLLVVRGAPPVAGALAARWFSPLGQWCIAALVVSAAFQGWVMVASLPGLVGTAYGWLVLVKLGLFAILLSFAAINRYRLAPALLRGGAPAARRALLCSLAGQTGFALAIVVAAVVLSDLPPSMHLQPLWPFAWRISLPGVRDGAGFAAQAWGSAAAVLAALLLLAASLRWRRWRLQAAGIVLATAWFALPHAGVRLARAYPTSFYRSPTGFSSEAIVQGSALYARDCAGCHGAAIQGDGPGAAAAPLHPAGLTGAGLWAESDGALFWRISKGVRAAPGQAAMPGFDGELDEDQRWALIDFLHAHAAGVAMRETGAFPRPVRAPAFAMRCGLRTLQSSDLSGRPIRLVIGALPGPQPAENDALTVVAGFAGSVPDGVCVARDLAVPAAFAILAGLAPGDAAGLRAQIGARGWLVAVRSGK